MKRVFGLWVILLLVVVECLWALDITAGAKFDIGHHYFNSESYEVDLGSLAAKTRFNSAFSVGVYGILDLGPYIAVQAEVIAGDGAGGSVVTSPLVLGFSGNGAVDLNFWVNYIEIPVLVRLPVSTFIRLPIGAVDIILGPEVLIKADKGSYQFDAADEATQLEIENNDLDYATLDEDDFNTFAYGIIVGLGTRYPVGALEFMLDVRYKYGMTEIVPGGAPTFEAQGLGGNYNQSALEVSVEIGYPFRTDPEGRLSFYGRSTLYALYLNDMKNDLRKCLTDILEYN
mgnify:CR=1 FL=1